MVQALAPVFSRGCSRVWVLIALLAGMSSGVASAQAPAGKAAAPPAKGAAPKAEPADPDDEVPLLDPSQGKKRESAELFKDPRAEKALPNTFKEYPYPSPRLNANDLTLIRTMASGAAGLDRAVILRFVDTMIADFSNHTNIKAVFDPPKDQRPNAEAVRAIERASQSIIEFLNVARAAKNDAFLAVYVPVLNSRLPLLLDNHLLPRIQASILLAQVAGPTSIDIFIKQIADPNQVVWVKHWSAQALTRATGGGKVILDVPKSTAAAAAILGFLEKEPDAPWPVKVRMLEALGSLRLPATGGPGGKADVPALALRYVSDPKAKVEVRAWAAWAIGMIPIPASTARYNYAIELYQIGRLAADLGEKIVAEAEQHEEKFPQEKDSAQYLAGLFLYQVYPALAGDDDVRNSGLLKAPNLGNAQAFAKGLDDQLKGLGRACIDLLNSGGAGVKAQRAALSGKVAELNSFLEKNRPTDVDLYPGGPKFPVAPPQVAGVPAAK